MVQSIDQIDIAIMAHKFEAMGLAQSLGVEPYSESIRIGPIISQTDNIDIVMELQGMDVVLVSENYGGLKNALKTVSLIRQGSPDIGIRDDMGIIGLSFQASSSQAVLEYEQRASDFFGAGANGYLSMIDDGSLDNLVEAVGVVKTGDLYLTNTSLKDLLEDQQEMIIERLLMQLPGNQMLDEREINVLRQFMEGLPNQEIGRVLGISRRNVEKAITNIYVKFDIKGNPPDKPRILLSRALGIVNLDSVVAGVGYALQQSPKSNEDHPVDYPGFKYRPDDEVVEFGVRIIPLENFEPSLMQYLVANPDAKLSRQSVSKGAWGSGRQSPQSLGNTMRDLMNKIQSSSPAPQFILPIHGGFYRFSTKINYIYCPLIEEYKPETGVVKIAGMQKQLTGNPRGIMDVLYEWKNLLVTDREIVDKVWGQDTNISLLKTPLSTLKSDLTIDSLQPSVIYSTHTTRGIPGTSYKLIVRGV